MIGENHGWKEDIASLKIRYKQFMKSYKQRLIDMIKLEIYDNRAIHGTERIRKVKTSENPSLFLWFQGVQKETSGMISVNSGSVPYISLNLAGKRLFYRR